MEPRHQTKRSASAPVTAVLPEADGISLSNTKRPRRREPHSIKLSTKVIPECGATILDALNTDCWRLVLDYVPVGDVVRSERVSRAWQRVVRDYLAGVHEYGIQPFCDKCSKGTPPESCLHTHRAWTLPVLWKRYRIIALPKRKLFNNMLQKIGLFVVSIFIVFCNNEMLEVIAANCPNLKHIKLFVEPWEESLQFGIFNKCKQFERLSLNLLNHGNDSSLKSISTMENLEELIIVKHNRLTGSFLSNLRTNLKTLIFIYCKLLQIEHIRTIADRLTGLTHLELSRNSISTLQNVHLLLNETPNLERLYLEYYHNPRKPNPLPEWGIEVPTAIGRLSRLRELRLWNNDVVTDEWLVIVARGCPALRVVDVGSTRVSARGLQTLCRERPELTELCVNHMMSVKDEDLEACVRYCGGLELLDASYCFRLTERLPALLARPRARPLQLRMRGVLRENIEVHYVGITFISYKPRMSYWPD